jgi:DNA-binding response OmpR family regulator
MDATGVARHPYRVLISDDDEECRETVREALAPLGYDTCLASCGQEAIEVVRRHFVHVMIVDMNMPDMDGVQTVRIIRHEVAVVPSILMSADSSREMMMRALSEQFESFLAKPFDIGALRHVVSDILRRHYETS